MKNMFKATSMMWRVVTWCLHYRPHVCYSCDFYTRRQHSCGWGLCQNARPLVLWQLAETGLDVSLQVTLSCSVCMRTAGTHNSFWSWQIFFCSPAEGWGWVPSTPKFLIFTNEQMNDFGILIVEAQVSLHVISFQPSVSAFLIQLAMLTIWRCDWGSVIWVARAIVAVAPFSLQSSVKSQLKQSANPRAVWVEGSISNSWEHGIQLFAETDLVITGVDHGRPVLGADMVTKRQLLVCTEHGALCSPTQQRCFQSMHCQLGGPIRAHMWFKQLPQPTSRLSSRHPGVDPAVRTLWPWAQKVFPSHDIRLLSRFHPAATARLLSCHMA